MKPKPPMANILKETEEVLLAFTLRWARGVLLIPLLAASFAVHPTDRPGAPSLHQLIEIAERDNKDLQAARYAVQIGKARLLQAGLLPNPRLELSGTNDFVFRNEGEYTNSVGISQQFPIAGRILRQQNVARVDIALAEAEVVEAARRLGGEVATNVYRIVVIDRQIQSRESLIGIEEKVGKATRDRYKAAEVSELDVNTVQLDIERLSQERALLRSQRQTLVVALNTLIGRSASAPLVFDERLPEADPLPTLKQFQTRALELRPDLRGARLGIDRAEAQRALAKAQRWEDWSVGLSVDQGRRIITGALPQGSDRAVMLSLSIPLPLFNKNQGLIAEADAVQDQASARIEALRAVITGEITGAYVEATNLQQALDRYRTSLMPVSARNVQLAQKGYGQGLVSVLEVVQAQRQQADIDAAYLNTLDGFLQALVRLRAAAGDYIPATGGDISPDAKEH